MTKLLGYLVSTGPGLPGGQPVATNNPKENLPDGSSSQYPDETEIKTCETGQEKLTRFRMATPPPDWEFRQILVKIAREMNKSDLKLAIAMFRGELKKLVRSETEYPIDLFEVLETRGFLDQNNLLYLQSILHHIDKPDLFDMVVEYAANTLDDVVHFQKPSDNPAPGYQYMKFHIHGSELERKYTRSALEELRNKASKIMCISPEYISIPGIEMGDSLLITLMVADKFVGLMQNALKHKTCRADLANLSVDNVRIHDKTWEIEGLDEYEIAQSNHHEQLKAAYSELENKQNTLEMRTIDLVEQKKKVTQNYFKDEALYKELQDTKCALDRKEIQYLELQTQRRGDIHDHEDKKTLGDYLLNVFIMSLIVYYLVALVNVDLPHTVRGIFNFNN